MMTDREFVFDLTAIWKYIKSQKGVPIILGFVIGIIIMGSAFYYLSLPDNPSVAQAPTLTPIQATSTATPLPTPTPYPPATAAPTVHSLVWTNMEVGVYLRDQPGGKILLAIPNGDEIAQIDNMTTYGGIEWVHSSVAGQEGWIATTYLFEVEGDYKRMISSGKWLYRDMAGAVDFYLWPGTPYQILQAVGGWLEIMLPDSRSGWIKTK